MFCLYMELINLDTFRIQFPCLLTTLRNSSLILWILKPESFSLLLTSLALNVSS
nr:hypothetical protein [Dinophyceae sp. MRD-151]